MGGTPRSKDKPPPSFETGAVRDPAIERLQDPGYDGSRLRAIIRRAVNKPATRAVGTSDRS